MTNCIYCNCNCDSDSDYQSIKRHSQPDKFRHKQGVVIICNPCIHMLYMKGELVKTGNYDFRVGGYGDDNNTFKCSCCEREFQMCDAAGYMYGDFTDIEDDKDANETKRIVVRCEECIEYSEEKIEFAEKHFGYVRPDREDKFVNS